MPNAWFRMYAEFASDPKVQMLSESDQRRYVMLLCMRCNGDATLQDDAVAFQLRISMDEWLETKAILLQKNLVNEDNKPTAWDKRQYISDSSTERSRHCREKKKSTATAEKQDATPAMQRDAAKCNVAATPPDTEQNRTEIRECVARARVSPLELSMEFERFWEAYPKKVGRGAAFIAFGKAVNEKGIENATIINGAKKFADVAGSDTQRFIPNPARWLDEERWADDPATIGKAESARGGNQQPVASVYAAGLRVARRYQKQPES